MERSFFRSNIPNICYKNATRFEKSFIRYLIHMDCKIRSFPIYCVGVAVEVVLTEKAPKRNLDSKMLIGFSRYLASGVHWTLVSPY